MSAINQHNSNKKPPFAVFLSAFVLLFFCSLSAADSIGFVPDYIDGSSPVADNGTGSLATGGSNAQIADNSDTGSQPIASASSDVPLSSLPQLGVTQASGADMPSTPTGIEPTRIIIPAGNIDLPVQNPSTTDVNALDALLKAGPAHYIDSADLGEKGNLIIFAHSSHLPVVINKMYQAFNNIPNLKSGDSITIEGSDGKNYLYQVVSVVKADVNDGTTIDTSPTHGTNLTLVTCDTLTGVSARFVLTATYIGTSQ